MNSDFELPKLKTNKPIYIDDNNLHGVYEIKNNTKKIGTFVSIVLLLFICFISYGMFLYTNHEFDKENIVDIKKIEVISYNKAMETIDIAIVPDSKQSTCLVTESDVNDNSEFQSLSNEKCYVTVGFDETNIYFNDEENRVSKALLIDDYVVDLKEKDVYYVPLNKEITLGSNMLMVGDPLVTWVSYDGILEIKDNVFKGIKIGSTTIKAMFNNEVIKEIKVVVTDTIVDVPKKFNSKKKYLGCEQFTSEQAKLLDEILEYRIKEAGYGTRAGAVAAARFLTLEFPYRIAYRWESGRLNNTGRHYVDGEGRYYHKGLYLDASKYESIEASLFGPAMWGCKMISYEEDLPYFIPGVKYANGLDCSGFVTWSLYNGGFDVGDRGAGELKSDGQLTDLGEFKKITKSLIDSGKIKVGDLFNFFGHISMLVGEDDDNYYIAESLNNLGGVVIMTYPKYKVMNTFKYVVLMDSVYNGDGNLTDMWY